LWGTIRAAKTSGAFQQRGPAGKYVDSARARHSLRKKHRNIVLKLAGFLRIGKMSAHLELIELCAGHMVRERALYCSPLI